MCLGVLPVYMYVNFIYGVLVQAREGIGSFGPGVRDSCELPCRCLELNLRPLEELPVLFSLSHLSGLSLYFPQLLRTRQVHKNQEEPHCRTGLFWLLASLGLSRVLLVELLLLEPYSI